MTTQIQHIMVAVDGSSGSDRAVDVAARLAKATGSELLIVTVMGSPTPEEAREFARVEGGVGDALEALAARTLHTAESRAREAGISKIEMHTGWGDVAQSLIETATRYSIDTIVLGRRGRGQLAGLLLGSVSQKIASLAPCTVVIVP